MTFGEGFDLVVMQVWSTVRLKGSNIFYRSIYATTGLSISFSNYERQVDENSARMRAFIRNYIQKRILGQSKSKVPQNSDMLSLFLQ